MNNKAKKHRAKLEHKARVDSLSRGLAHSFSNWVQENNPGWKDMQWEIAQEELPKVVARWLVAKVPVLGTAKALRVGKAVVRKSHTQLTVDMQKLAALLIELQDKDAQKKAST